MTTNEQMIKSVKVIGDDALMIVFKQIWNQENISDLTYIFFKYLNDAIKQDCAVGADRESIRFTWQQEHFILNFECYSQSCWIEVENTPNLPLLKAIEDQLLF